MKNLQLAILCLASVAISLGVSAHFCKTSDDFVGIYGAAELAGTGHLFESDRIGRIEAQFQTKPGVLPFLRLPIYAFLWKPLTWVPFAVARAFWFVLNAAAMIAALLLWPVGTRWQKIFVITSYPFLYNLMIGQDTALVLLFAVLGWRCLEKRKRFAAGLLFSLCAVKFNLALLLPVFLVARRQWAAIAGAGSGVAALAALSCVEGLDWPLREFRSMQLAPQFHGEWAMPNAYGFASWFAHSGIIEIAAAAALAVVVGRLAMRAGSNLIPIAAVLAAGLLTSHHAFLYDAVVLMPILLMAAGASGIARLLAALLISPVPYLLPLGQYGYFWMEMQILVIGSTLGLLVWLLRDGTEPSIDREVPRPVDGEQPSLPQPTAAGIL